MASQYTQVIIGDIIKIKQIQFDDPGRLHPSPSTYQFGGNIEFRPDSDATYIVCSGDEYNGFLLCKVGNPTLQIGYCLKKDDDKYYVQVTQHLHELKLVSIAKVGDTIDIPIVYRIGSHILFCKAL